MKKILLILILPAFFSCIDDPIEPTPNSNTTNNVYLGEVSAKNNNNAGAVWLNGEYYDIFGSKSMTLKTGDTLRVVADNVGQAAEYENSTIWVKLDGEFLFTSTRLGDQDTTIIIQ